MSRAPSEAVGVPAGQSVSLVSTNRSRGCGKNGRPQPALWQHYFPLATSCFSRVIDDVDLDRFYAAINHVEPSFIRVEADEVTYNRIALRFEIEVALVDGDLRVNELPEAWNAKMRDYWALHRRTMRRACSGRALVFRRHRLFSTYSLGNLTLLNFSIRRSGTCPI